MPRQSYLHVSRHHVYYLRIVVPSVVRTALGLTNREVRLSLKTKDRKIARIRLAERTLAMTKLFQQAEAWEVDADERLAKYKRGLKLIQEHGKYDLDDEFEWDHISTELTGNDLEAYVFATQHLEQKSLKAKNKVASPSRKTSPPAITTQASKTNSPPSNDKRPDEKILTALDRFAKGKLGEANQATVERYVSQVRMFLKIVSNGNPDMKLSDLTVANIQDYCDALHDLPRKVSPDDPRSLQELRASASKKMSARTKTSHARATAMFLDWCEKQQYRMQQGLNHVLAPLRKTPKTKSIRKHFTETELKSIFEAREYSENLFQRESDYWIPLLGLLTGARQAELCQLHVDDVYQDPEASIWIIDINASTQNKHLKTESSPRKVPVHSKLIELGFTDFVKQAVSNGQQRLFPNEHRNTRGEFDAFSKRFNRYLARIGIAKSHAQRLNFHSFRHTLQTDLLSKGQEEYIVNQLVGHSPANSSQSVKTYSKGASLASRRHVLEDFQPNICLYPRTPKS